MKKIILCFTLCIYYILNVLAENAPIKSCGWNWKDGYNLKGKIFYDVAESYKEQDGYAFIEGYGNLHYWLYDTYTFHEGKGKDIIEKYLPYWTESMGYRMDFENVKEYSPNSSLADSVKKLMKQKNCDLSVLLKISESYILVNNYDEKENSYSTYVFPLISISGESTDSISYSYSKNPLSIMGFDKNSTRASIEKTLKSWGISYSQYFPGDGNAMDDIIHNTFGAGETRVLNITWQGISFTELYFDYTYGGKLAKIEFYPDKSYSLTKLKEIFNNVTQGNPVRRTITYNVSDNETRSLFVKNGQNENESAVLSLDLHTFEFYFRGGQLIDYHMLESW